MHSSVQHFITKQKKYSQKNVQRRGRNKKKKRFLTADLNVWDLKCVNNERACCRFQQQIWDTFLKWQSGKLLVAFYERWFLCGIKTNPSLFFLFHPDGCKFSVWVFVPRCEFDAAGTLACRLVTALPRVWRSYLHFGIELTFFIFFISDVNLFPLSYQGSVCSLRSALV